MLPTKTFKMRKVVNPPKAEREVEVILKTCELFIYGDINIVLTHFAKMPYK